MYTDKRLEKSLTTLTPISPAPLGDVHHTHPLPHPQTQTHLHNLHTHHIQQHPHHVVQQMEHLQQQQLHVAISTPQHLPQHRHQQQQQQQHQIQQHHQQHPTNQQHVTLNQQQHPQQPPQQQQQSQQQQSAMFTRFDANKSTKGASKLRRDLINAEIANLRDLLPLPQSTRQRLSQLQLMALVCVYVRKANYFQQVFKRHDLSVHHAPTPNIGFSKALSGFLMMLTQNGKLLYISDNAAEYLGHSMEDLLIHGDSVYDIIDKQDHAAIQAELNRNVPPQPGQHTSSNAAATAAAAITSLEGEHRMFLCRMNVSRNARRQMRFGDQKVVLVQGHYLSFLPLCSRNEPVFLATCTPIAMPETRECVVQGATNVFTTIHSMDMKIVHIDKNGEFHLGYSKSDLQGISWYNLMHSDNLREAQSKHRLITQSEQDRSCILLVRMQRHQGDFIWVHVVLQIRDNQDTNQQPVIVCTNQVLNEREASVMITNSWLYHYYSVQSKIQFGLPFEGATRVPPTTPTAATAAAVYYHHHVHSHHPHHHHHHTATPLPAATVAGTYPTMHHPHHHPNHQYHHMAAFNAYHTAAGSGVGSGGGEGGSPGQQHHHSNGTTSGGINGHSVSSNAGSMGTQYVYHHRLGLEPVDYSQVSGNANTARSPSNSSAVNVSDLRCSSTNSSVSSHTTATPSYTSHNTNATSQNNAHSHHPRLGSPPAKKRAAVSKLEPLYLPDDSSEDPPQSTPITTNNIDTHYTLRSTIYGSVESHASVAFATVVPTRPRLLSKALPSDTPDFIDQWNPSPPWSDTAQKISLDSSSSSTQQELSPCITTTPPTPTSAPPNGLIGVGMQTLGSAFSFEWMSDQLVPMTDPCISCLTTTDGVGPIPVVMANDPHSTPRSIHWASTIPPTDHHHHLSQHLASQGHRLINLTGNSDNLNTNEHLHDNRDDSAPKTDVEDVAKKESSRN